MAKAYLIGGSCRTGKTTLTMRFIKERPTLATSTDALRRVLQRIIEQETEPDLFHFKKYTSNPSEHYEYIKNHIPEMIDIQNRESAVVWPSVRNFINANVNYGCDVLIEGVTILPQYVSELDCDYNAVFLGNQSMQHRQVTLASARDNPYDWMHSYDDEVIGAFADINRAFSTYVDNEASKHGLRYIEIKDTSFETDITKALHLLLQ